MGGSPIWPVTLECGDLVLRPIRYRDRKEWTEVRSRNSEWLAPWEASNPAPGGGLPDYRQMVRSLKVQAAQSTALPFLITAWTPGFREPVIVGQLTVSSIVWGSAMMATLGYWVDKARAGQGIAPTAVALATDYCFQTWGCTGWRSTSVRKTDPACGWLRSSASATRATGPGSCTSTANGQTTGASR